MEARKMYYIELVQSSVSFGQALGKTGQKPGFSINLRKLF
jgi:hypothetical protein